MFSDGIQAGMPRYAPKFYTEYKRASPHRTLVLAFNNFYVSFFEPFLLTPIVISGKAGKYVIIEEKIDVPSFRLYED